MTLATTTVSAAGVTKRYGTAIALDGVSLTVRAGEVRGVLGRNGAGKTTLLRILFGLVAPDSGSVELFGLPGLGPGRPALEGVAGFVEEPNFYPYLTGRVNLELCAELDAISAPERIDEVLELVGLGGRDRDRVNGYSTGMRKRLGIAAALLRSPRLLLLDEPTAGLDPPGIREIDELIHRLSADGVTVLLSSHQIAEVESVCDSFTFLRRGRAVWDGSAAELKACAPASTYAVSTSDDCRAAEIAEVADGVGLTFTSGDDLELTAESDCLDSYVVALGQNGIAVRRLELRVSPLESMFFALTADPEADEVPVAI